MSVFAALEAGDLEEAGPRVWNASPALHDVLRQLIDRRAADPHGSWCVALCTAWVDAGRPPLPPPHRPPHEHLDTPTGDSLADVVIACARRSPAAPIARLVAAAPENLWVRLAGFCARPRGPDDARDLADLATAPSLDADVTPAVYERWLGGAAHLREPAWAATVGWMTSLLVPLATPVLVFARTTSAPATDDALIAIGRRACGDRTLLGAAFGAALLGQCARRRADEGLQAEAMIAESEIAAATVDLREIHDLVARFPIPSLTREALARHRAAETRFSVARILRERP